MFALFLWACTSAGGKPVGVHASSDSADSGDSGGTGDSGGADTGVAEDPFIDAVVSFEPGESAGYGQDTMPDVVLGSPMAPGGGGGSTDVVSLGREGEIVVRFDDITLIDGDGVDLLVFENAFTGWLEPGVVAASEDGVIWQEWPCDVANAAENYPGCAGVASVYVNATNGIDATDPDTAGGDAFDLADIGLTRAAFVRVRDAGVREYGGIAGGFDLDAMAVVNGE